MNDLQERYRGALKARAEALEAAQQALAEGAPETRETIRRIAHSLRGSGGTYGFPEVSRLAAAVEDATAADLAGCLERLLRTIRDLARPRSGQPVELLLVEDDPEMAGAISGKLSAHDRQITVAGSVRQAEQLLAERHFALIVLDLILPDQDGRVFLARLRERPGTAAIPVFVLTARAGNLTRIECLAQGAEQFFEKPLDLVALATATSARLQRANEIERETRRDFLTGLFNRAGLCEAFATARAHAVRQDEHLSLAVLDLDHFKRVNDSHGHAVGDDVLRRAAALIQGTFRKSDTLARWGGEEFVAIFPSTSAEGAVLALEKALEILRRERFSGASGALFSVTFSAGVSDVRACESAADAVAVADRLLYQAKAAGRNQICSSANPAPRSRPCVLLAEDDHEVAAVIKDLLGHEGCEVIHVTNGLAAVEVATGTPVSLIILDVNMPGQDGFTTLARLREASPCAGVPTVMLTALGKEQDVLRGFDLGADDYVVKPFSPPELLARIRRLLRRR